MLYQIEINDRKHCASESGKYSSQTAAFKGACVHTYKHGSGGENKKTYSHQQFIRLYE